MADEFSTLDRQIKELYDCKPLTESEVEALCDKVVTAALASCPAPRQRVCPAPPTELPSQSPSPRDARAGA